MILTPELVSKRLDALGSPRRLEARREITLDEARAFLRNVDHRARLQAVGKQLGCFDGTVERVWTLMLSEGRWRVR